MSTLVALMLALAAPVQATATIHSPPWADIFGSQWNDLNTIQSARNFYNNLSSTYSRFLDLNKTANIAMSGSYAQSDAVWVTFGHGGPGFITYCNPPGGSSCTSVLRATSQLGSCSSPNACLSSSGTSIHRIRLMIFAGCETALNGKLGGTNNGNLLDQAVNSNGVDSVVGWKPLIYWPQAELWATKAATYLSNSNNTVNWSMYSAGQDVKNAYGSAWGWDQWDSRNGGIKIIPAAYGT